MAITVDVASLGTGFSSGIPASLSLTTGSAVASGGFIVLCVSQFSDTTTNMVSSFSGGGLSWTIDKNSTAGEASGKRIAWGSAQAPSGLASGTSLTVNFAGGFAGIEVIIGGLSLLGVATSSPVDGTPQSISDASASTYTTTAYTIQNGSILLGAAVSDNTTGHSATTGTEAWERFISADAYAHAVTYRIEPTGGSFSVAGNFGTSGTITKCAIAYLAAAGGGPVTNEAALRTAHTPVTWRT